LVKKMCGYVFLVGVINEGYLSRYEAVKEREGEKTDEGKQFTYYYTLGSDCRQARAPCRVGEGGECL
jgi:hypothetical protein